MPDYGGGQTKVIHDLKEGKQLCRESARKPDKLIIHLQYDTTAKWHWNLSIKSPKETTMLQRSPGSLCLGNTHLTTLLSSAGKQQDWKQRRSTGELRRYSWSEIISSSWVTGRSESLQGSSLRGSDASEMPPTVSKAPVLAHGELQQAKPGANSRKTWINREAEQKSWGHRCLPALIAHFLEIPVPPTPPFLCWPATSIKNIKLCKQIAAQHLVLLTSLH